MHASAPEAIGWFQNFNVWPRAKLSTRSPPLHVQLRARPKHGVHSKQIQHTETPTCFPTRNADYKCDLHASPAQAIYVKTQYGSHKSTFSEHNNTQSRAHTSVSVIYYNLRCPFKSPPSQKRPRIRLSAPRMMYEIKSWAFILICCGGTQAYLCFTSLGDRLQISGKQFRPTQIWNSWEIKWQMRMKRNLSLFLNYVLNVGKSRIQNHNWFMLSPHLGHGAIV